MASDKDILGKLPGSARGDRARGAVDNHTLMPASKKLPGRQPAKAAFDNISPPELLGSGSKIPQSQHSRMRAQFASPDPAKFRARKKREREEEDNSQWSNELRPAPINAMPYKSVPQESAADKGGGPVTNASRAAKARAEKAVESAQKEQARVQAEHNRLRGQKEAMLSNLCMTNNTNKAEIKRVVNIVMNINKQLGLSSTDMGSWKLP